MRGLLLGLMGGLTLGALGALVYSHYLGEGRELVQAQADLAAARLNLATTAQENHQTKSQFDAMSAQIQQLNARKDDLDRQVKELQTNAVASSPPAAVPNANSMATMMKAGMAQHYQQQLQLLETRLHLTPEQEETLKTAMDAESKRGEEMATKMLSGGKMDPQSLTDLKNVKSVDQTLNEILTPDQKTAYDQLKTDQKTSAAETMASVEMNQMTPLLQLSDTQKDQVYTALYQNQLDEQNPAWIKNNVSTPTDPTSILDKRNQSKEEALAKILTPDQMTAYHQQMQNQLAMQKAMLQRFSPATVQIAPVSAPAP